MNSLYHKKTLTHLVLFVLFFSISILGFTPDVKADYTINAGSTIDPATTPALLNATGTISIYGTLAVNANVTFTSASPLTILIYGSSGQINWYANKTLAFPAGSTITYINNPTAPPGLVGTPQSASKILKIGTVNYAAANDNSNNVVYSFAELNNIGGTARVNPSPGTGPFCSGSSINFLANQVIPTGDVIKVLWTISPSNGTFSPNNTSTATSTTLSALAANTYTITCDLYSDAGNGNYFLAASKNFTFSVTAPGTWLGVNTDWTSTSNWCNGTVPDVSTDVTIPTGRAYYPTISTTASVKNLTVQTGAAALVTVSSGGTLKIAGTVASTNGINSTAGTIEMIGSATQTVRADNFVSNTVGNITISNTTSSASSSNPSVAISALGSMLNVAGAVSFGNVSNAVLTTNDNLTLLSSATATARIADLTNNSANSGNNISGKVVVERYIPGKRAWRLLSAPITKASNVSMSASWQEGGRSATVNSVSNPNPGYGTHISYGSPATNGYDQGINGNTSIRYLNTTGWNGVPTGTDNASTLNAGNVADQPGYFLFVRGDRSTLLSSGTGAAASPSILRVKGNLNIGQIPISLGTTYTVGSSNFRVISNPYAAAINFKKIFDNNPANLGGTGTFLNSFYMWDANITGSNGVGGWVGLSYNTTTSSYDKTVASSNISTNGDIQSGSAFVINFNGAGTLTILESNKSTNSDNKQFRPAKQNQQLRISLLAKNADNTVSVNDGALVLFDSSYSNLNDGADMNKMPNFAENFGVVNNGELLALERRQNINKTDTIAFRMSQMKQKNYQLELLMGDITAPKGTAAFLEDQFLQTKTPVNLKNVTTYDFSVTNNSLTSVADRFRLIFKPSVEYVTVKGKLIENDIAVDWKIANELNISRYEIERSNESMVFSTIGSLNSKGDNPAATDYKWVDANAAAGNYFYRIKSTSKNGIVAYSKLVNIKVFNRTLGIIVINNPVTDNTIKLQINDSKKGVYNVRLLNAAGQFITAKTINYLGGSSTVSIESSQNLLSGNYHLQVDGPQNKLAAIKVIVQK